VAGVLVPAASEQHGQVARGVSRAVSHIAQEENRKRSPQGGARANLPWPFYRYRLSFAATIRRARVTCFRSAL
jgi:hypothetical protein